MREFSFALSQKKDASWEKYCTLETWADKGCEKLVDYDFWIDIDSVGDKAKLPVEATLEASKGNCGLLLDFLSDRYKIEPDHVQTFFSGHSGFHVLVPFRLPDAADVWAERLLGNAKRLTEDFANALAPRWAATSKIDHGIYKTNGLIRVPYSRHRNGLRKVKVNRVELDLSVEELLDVIEQRSSGFEGEYSLDWWDGKKSDEAIAARLLEGKATGVAASGGIIQRNLSQVESGLPSCLKAVLGLSPKLDWSRIRFQEPKMFIICHLKTLGYLDSAAIEVLEQFVDDYSRHIGDSETKIRERKQQIQSSVRTIYKSQPGSRYDFSIPNRCGSIFKAKFPALGKLPCLIGKCPRADNSKPQPTVGRQLSIKEVLNRKLSGNELLVYLTVAIVGPFTQKSEIEAATGLSKGTVRKILETFEKRKLVKREKGRIVPLKPVRSNAMVKI
ncbi:MAG: hypothetical protein H6508_08135 [Calditrichaeota bacterium]|nr:hypothetical protein [Calditrichota bacterium]